MHLTLVGFNEKTADEVEQGILKKKLRLGIKKFNGINYATIEGVDGYLASVKATNTKYLSNDGYIDLLKYKDAKILLKILGKTDKSMNVKLRMVG